MGDHSRRLAARTTLTSSAHRRLTAIRPEGLPEDLPEKAAADPAPESVGLVPAPTRAAPDRASGSGSGGRRAGPAPPTATYRLTGDDVVRIDAAVDSEPPEDRERSGSFRRTGTDSAVSVVRQRLRAAAGRFAEHWVPDALRGGRLSPGRPGALALGAVAVIAAVAAAIGAWAQRPVVEPAPDLPAASGVAHHEPLPPTPGRSGSRRGGARPGVESASVDPADGAAAPVGQPAGALIVVSVIGRVARPGLVSLPTGARVADAVHAVGELLPGTDLHTLNLARRLVDGEQIDVGAPDPTAAVSGGAASAGSAAGSGAGAPGSAGAARSRGRERGRPAGGARVSLNLASIDQLLGISGVGPVTAQRILDWRTQHGQFTSIDQLREVGGIGPAKFARLKDQVTL